MDFNDKNVKAIYNIKKCFDRFGEHQRSRRPFTGKTRMPQKTITVSAAIIIRTNSENKKQEVFATARGYGAYKGWWEFPGGKLEKDESPEQCIVREIQEELATQVKAEKKLATVEYDYPEFHLVMHCIQCSIVSGNLELLEHQEAKWLNKDTLNSVKWLPSDLLVMDKLQTLLS